MKLCVIWNMHRPNGWHPTQRQFVLPWNRIHTLRYYLPFLRLTEEFPTAPLTIAASPDLLRRLEQSTLKATRESMLGIHRKPAVDLQPTEIEDLVGLAFSATPEAITSAFPCWHSLWLRWRAHRGIDSRFIETLSKSELQDLQALVQLGWMDESLQARVPELSRKARAGESFQPEDAAILVDLQLEAMRECLQLLRKRCRAGEIEFLGAPLHRVVLPLLRGESSAYSYPEDARAQLVRGPRVQYLNFGAWPSILYLPEGGCCKQTAALLPEVCLRAAVASSRVLRESLGHLPSGQELGSCWTYRGSELVFTHAEIEGQMRFLYPRLNATKALDDLWGRVDAVARDCQDEGAALTLEMDLSLYGPNDHAERMAFWRGVLSRLAGLQEEGTFARVRGSTLKSAMETMPRRALDSIRAFSRRSRGLASWSAEARPLYWKALTHAREQFQNVRAWKTLPPERLTDARASILVLESVEWIAAMENGLDAFTQRKTESLFRAHLDSVYRSLDVPRPPWFQEALLPCEVRVTSIGPSLEISPALDGKTSSYHSWSGSGFFRNREEGGCSRDILRRLSGVYFGADSVNAYFRVALPAPAKEMLRHFELQGVLHAREGEQMISWFRIAVSADGKTRLESRLAVPPSPGEEAQALAVVEDVADLRLPLRGLGMRLGEVLRFQVSLWEHDNAVASAPTLGWEEFLVDDHITYVGDAGRLLDAAEWSVAAG
ncbi:MAG: hypothetical protein IT169_00505 [Bryobacterales bacterium]|nr:hypothetical protein [Bryobacterales bacterium]